MEEHAHYYDPTTDIYDCPPFDQPITTTKATAIYNMHTYWSKKPHDAIQQYIRHYTQPGDLVLDPFCGSGGTALAALMEGRAAVAIDLSPAATFITKNYCTPVDVEELQRAFEELKAKVKPEMDWLYETRCDRCDGRATTAYTVYSYVFECPKCGEHTPLFDCPEVQVAGKDGKPKTITVCPQCQVRKAGDPEDYEISTRTSKRFDPIPVLVSYLCEEGCKPQRGERRPNDKDPKKREYFEKYDLGKLREIEEKPIPYWYPPNRMMNVESDTESWGDKWRSGSSSFRTVAQLFTKRNLWALALIKDNSKTQLLSSIFDFSLTGSSLHCSTMATHKETGGGFMMGTYYVPQISKERNVWNTFSRKLKENYQGLETISLKSVNLLISSQSATDYSEISDDSIDYVFTDPPYADKIQYGELNFVWEALLDLNTKWQTNEIIVNHTRGKTNAIWADLLHEAMSECYRVLKPGRWISVCYHDSSEGTWQLLQDIMAEVGFISEQTETTLFIDAGQKSYNQLNADKATKRDLVINFRKPRVGETAGKLILIGDEDATTFLNKARAILIEALDAHPGSTTDRLYDELVSRMVRRGEFERHNFDELLRSVAEPVIEPAMKNLFEKEEPNLWGTHETVRWYLIESAGLVDETEAKKETAAAAKLEAFMQTQLKAHPSEPGVHYSDLFELYLPIQDKPRRLLADWLPEFFFKTPEGTWRPPKDEEERQQKLGLRLSGTLRQIKHFVNALQEGVPPSERDKPANAATLADWIYQCRRAGLYELGNVLYEKGGLQFDGLSEESRLQVEEDYQICVKRGKTAPEKLRKSNRAVQLPLE
ncbi:MAG: DNA methyltransferase [Anaerolineaceae bacterium]|nr:DNA methyltransferase [Anaerolineaceae bacterium]